MFHVEIIKDGDVTKVQKEILVDGQVYVDETPREGSVNLVTSGGVNKAIADTKESVDEDVQDLQEQIDDIAEKAGSGYIPKGEADVATLNGLTGQENGWLYTMTDAGTLTDGSLAVVAGDTVAWDATNEVWYIKQHVFTPTENEWLPKENGVQIELVGNTAVDFQLGYYDLSGFHSSASHQYCEIDPLFVGEVAITKNAVGANVPLLVIAHSDGTYTGYMSVGSADSTQSVLIQQYLKSGDKIFINKFSSVTNIKIKTVDGVSAVNGLAKAVADKEATTIANAVLIQNSNAGKLLPEAMCYGKELTIDPFTLTPVKTGKYIGSNGSEASHAGSAYFAFDAHGIKKITISGSGTGAGNIYHVIIKYPNGELQTWVAANESSGTITIQKGEIATIYINRFENISLSWKIQYYTRQEMLQFESRTFPNIVRKPFEWNTRKVLIVGDSIAKGFTDGETITTYTWAYWLNQKLGFSSLTNGAVGGAAFNDYGISTVKAQLVAHASDDVNTIFIGAGFNDWMRGATFAEVKAAVDDTLDYIFANMSDVTNVIVVTPIECAGYRLFDKTRRTGPDSLDDIRQAITEAVIEHPNAGNCSVIDGKTFGFPNVLGDSSFISAVFGDRLHPTEKGYADVYAPALLERIS